MDPVNPPAWLRHCALGLAWIGLYLGLEALTAVRPAYGIGVTPWNPGAALMLVFLMARGWAAVPFVVIGYALDEHLLHATNAAPLVVLVGALLMTLAYLVLAMLLRRRLPPMPIGTITDSARLIVAAACAAFLGAGLLIGWFRWWGELAATDTGAALLRQGFADLNGVLMLTPLLLHVREPRQLLWLIRAHRKAAVACMAAVTLALLLLFALPAPDQLRYFYLLFIPIIWAALRWGSGGALFAVCWAQAGLVLAARLGIHEPRFVDLQVFMLTLTLTALLLGALVLERRRVDEQLRARDASLARAMQFAVAGELASALTHELSQPVAAVRAYLEAARSQADAARSDDSLPSTLGRAQAAAVRAAEVLQRLRDFYRGDETPRETIDLTAVATDTAQRLEERMRAAGARFTLDAPGPVLAGTNEQQLSIVLHNLLSNAVEAVASRPPEHRRIALWLRREAEAIIICCEDSGPGVPAELVGRLFEPFVTDKPAGMGLGLALSRKLVRALGGDLLYADSDMLGGARFTLRLPP